MVRANCPETNDCAFKQEGKFSYFCKCKNGFKYIGVNSSRGNVELCEIQKEEEKKPPVLTLLLIIGGSILLGLIIASIIIILIISFKKRNSESVELPEQLELPVYENTQKAEEPPANQLVYANQSSIRESRSPQASVSQSLYEYPPRNQEEELNYYQNINEPVPRPKTAPEQRRTQTIPIRDPSSGYHKKATSKFDSPF